MMIRLWLALGALGLGACTAGPAPPPPLEQSFEFALPARSGAPALRVGVVAVGAPTDVDPTRATAFGNLAWRAASACPGVIPEGDGQVRLDLRMEPGTAGRASLLDAASVSPETRACVADALAALDDTWDTGRLGPLHLAVFLARDDSQPASEANADPAVAPSDRPTPSTAAASGSGTTDEGSR